LAQGGKKTLQLVMGGEKYREKRSSDNYNPASGGKTAGLAMFKSPVLAQKQSRKRPMVLDAQDTTKSKEGAGLIMRTLSGAAHPTAV